MFACDVCASAIVFECGKYKFLCTELNWWIEWKVEMLKIFEACFFFTVFRSHGYSIYFFACDYGECVNVEKKFSTCMRGLLIVYRKWSIGRIIFFSLMENGKLKPRVVFPKPICAISIYVYSYMLIAFQHFKILKLPNKFWKIKFTSQFTQTINSNKYSQIIHFTFI